MDRHGIYRNGDIISVAWGSQESNQIRRDAAVVLTVRPRWKRALRWPWLVWQFRRAGVSWRTACRMAWHTVTYRGAA